MFGFGKRRDDKRIPIVKREKTLAKTIKSYNLENVALYPYRQEIEFDLIYDDQNGEEHQLHIKTASTDVNKNANILEVNGSPITDLSTLGGSCIDAHTGSIASLMKDIVKDVIKEL